MKMVGLKESVKKAIWVDVSSGRTNSLLDRWAEGYIKELEEYLTRLYKLPVSQLDPNDSIHVILRFLRNGEEKK